MIKNKRIIKFRGKDKINGEWVYGYFFKLPDDTCWIRVFIDKNTFEDREVILETVGQYIGLPDKNGVEIYESDIMLWQSMEEEKGVGDKYEVVFDQIQCRFKLEWLQDRNQTHHPSDEFEVIGNIFENSELLVNLEG